MTPFSDDRGLSSREMTGARGLVAAHGIAHRRALYHFVGEALSRPSGASREVVSAWIASALHESSPEVRAGLPPAPSGPLSELLGRLLLQLDTTFTRGPASVTREFSMYIARPDAPVSRVTQRSEHPWDEVPENVRAAFLLQPGPVEFRHWAPTGGR
jgi:hypothetical protein